MPPLTLENAGALVRGGATASDIAKEKKLMQAQQTQPQTASVRVLRPFYFSGKPTKVGDTIELPRLFALEMKAAHKVEIVPPKPEAKIEARAEDKPEAKKAEGRAGQRGLV